MFGPVYVDMVSIILKLVLVKVGQMYAAIRKALEILVSKVLIGFDDNTQEQLQGMGETEHN